MTWVSGSHGDALRRALARESAERVHRRARRSRACRARREARCCKRVFDYVGVGFSWGRTEECVRLGGEDGVHRRARRSRASDAARDPRRSRTRRARRSARARCPGPSDRDPAEYTVTNRVDWTRCVSRLRVRRLPPHRAMASPLHDASVVGARSVVHETQPSSSPPRHLRVALVRRPSFFDRFRIRRGGRHRSLGQRRRGFRAR